MNQNSFVHSIPGMTELLNRLPLPNSAHRALFIIDTLIQDMVRCDILKQASAMAYTTLLSIAPSLAGLFSILALFTPIIGENSQVMIRMQNYIISNLAQGTGSQVTDILNSYITNLNVTKIGIGSFAGVLATLIILLKQVEKSLNRIWLVRKERSMFTRFIYFWTFLTLGAFVASLVIGFMSGFDLDGLLAPFSLGGINSIGGADLQSDGTSHAIGFSVTFLFFFLLYKAGPNCKVSLIEAGIGAAIASILFQIAGNGFGYYVANFSKHTAIYGALAALPLFLTWIYICWIIILFGSLVAWRIQQGFPVPHGHPSDGADNDSPPEMKMRELRLQTIAPLLVLMAIYREFLSGSGQGLSGTELARKINIPSTWISEALDTLESMQYIIAALDSDELAPSGDYMSSQFFPSIPPEKITIAKIFNDLLEPANISIEKWNRQIPRENIELIEMFQKHNIKNTPNRTIASMFETTNVEPQDSN